jgi:outer membrane lipoprotein LolB
MLLAACAQQPQRDQPNPRPLREAIIRYSLDGRVSVKRGKEARQAGINWKHDSDRDDIELSGPLGQKAARLSREASGARLDTATREVFVAADWEGLAERALGVALPLNNMARWVTATFSADAQVERDAIGRPIHVLVNGWQIDYLAYESDLPDALPALITLHRDDIDLRLKIDEWLLN